MSNIKQAGFLARPVMRVDDAKIGVLYGHVMSAKGHKFCAVLCMETVQRGLLERILRIGRSIANTMVRRLRPLLSSSFRSYASLKS